MLFYFDINACNFHLKIQIKEGYYIQSTKVQKTPKTNKTTTNCKGFYYCTCVFKYSPMLNMSYKS